MTYASRGAPALVLSMTAITIKGPESFIVTRTTLAVITGLEMGEIGVTNGNASGLTGARGRRLSLDGCHNGIGTGGYARSGISLGFQLSF